MGLTLGSTIPAPGQQGTLTGRVSLSAPPQRHIRAPRRGIYRGGEAGGATPQMESRSEQYKYIVVSLTAEGLSAGPPPDQPVGIDQIGVHFVPHILPIVRGTTVKFPNLDNIYHNVFSYSKTQKFDLGRYRQGESRSVTFSTAGVVRLFCEIHAQMSAVILVLDTPYFTLAENGQPFLIPDIPAGAYTMTAWHEHLPARTVPVSITAGDTSRVDVTL